MVNGKWQIGVNVRYFLNIWQYLAGPHSVASIDRSLFRFDDETINIDFFLTTLLV